MITLVLGGRDSGQSIAGAARAPAPGPADRERSSAGVPARPAGRRGRLSSREARRVPWPSDGPTRCDDRYRLDTVLEEKDVGDLGDIDVGKNGVQTTRCQILDFTSIRVQRPTPPVCGTAIAWPGRRRDPRSLLSYERPRSWMPDWAEGPIRLRLLLTVRVAVVMSAPDVENANDVSTGWRVEFHDVADTAAEHRLTER
jgi:hypothetical protein